ncbi:MAG: GNAT family N-acetyltransferase [Patescibacteria group bacterium]
MIIPYQKKKRTEVKKFVLNVLSEFGFSYNRRADFDLSEIDKYYSKTNRSIFLLYIDKNKILGTIALKKLDKDTAELKRFYVANEYRGQSIGRQLHSEVLKYAQVFKYKKIILNTTPNMLRAIEFYKRAGYKRLRQQAKNLEQVYFQLDVSHQ